MTKSSRSLIWIGAYLLAALVALLISFAILAHPADAQQVILSLKEQQTLKALMGPSGKIEQLILTETALHPVLSTTGTARIMADSVTHALLCSFNGGAYSACLGGGGSLTGTGDKGRPATWSTIATTLTYSPFYTDVVAGYGAVCDGTTNIHSAIAAAIAAGKTRLFLPGHSGAECRWIPAGNLIPANIEILGENWNYVTIESTDPATLGISLGNNSLIQNVRFKHKPCSDAPGAPTYCPTRWTMNNSGATRPLGNWPNQPMAFYVGGTDQGSNDRPGLYGETFGDGDAVFLQNNAGGPGLRVYSRGTSSSAGVEITRWTNVPGLHIDSGSSATTDYSLTVSSDYQTGGGLMRLRHTTSTFNGDVIVGDMAAGSGSFGGKFFSFKVNSVDKATLSAAGDLVLATALKVPSGGTGATTLTGLVKGNGASAMTAYAGSTCAALNFVTGVDLNGVVTCDIPVGGSGNVTHTGNLTANQLVIGNAVADLKVLGTLGTTTTVLHGNAAGAPTFGAVVEADITLADNTTNDVSIARHGFVPKAPNDITLFLRGDGTWATTAGSFAPTNATFVTMSLNGTLTNERVLTAGPGIGLADGGANSTATISVAQATNFAWTGTHSWNQQAALTLLPFGAGAGQTGEIRFRELAANGVTYVGFKAPDSIATNVMWTLPSALPGSTQCWASSSTGVMSFQACSSGITGSGANTQVTYWTGVATQAGSSSFTWDDAVKSLAIAGNTAIKGPQPWADARHSSFAGGATCDGAADDTAAIQAAVNSGAGIIILPAGVCRVTTVAVPSSKTVRGQGTGATDVKRLSGTSALFTTDKDVTMVRFQDFNIDGNGVDADGIMLGNGTYGSFDLITNILIDRISCGNMGGGSTSSTKACVFANKTSKIVKISNSVMTGGAVGIHNDDSSPPIFIEDNIIIGESHTGVLNTGSGAGNGRFGAILHHNFLYSNGYAVKQSSIAQLHMYGNEIEGNTAGAVLATNSTDVRLIDNFGNCAAGTVMLDFVGDVSPLHVTGNTITNTVLNNCKPLQFASFPANPLTTSSIIANNKFDQATGVYTIPTSILVYGNTQNGAGNIFFAGGGSFTGAMDIVGKVSVTAGLNLIGVQVGGATSTAGTMTAKGDVGSSTQVLILDTAADATTTIQGAQTHFEVYNPDTTNGNYAGRFQFVSRDTNLTRNVAAIFAAKMTSHTAGNTNAQFEIWVRSAGSLLNGLTINSDRTVTLPGYGTGGGKVACWDGAGKFFPASSINPNTGGCS